MRLSRCAIPIKDSRRLIRDLLGKRGCFRSRVMIAPNSGTGRIAPPRETNSIGDGNERRKNHLIWNPSKFQLNTIQTDGEGPRDIAETDPSVCNAPGGFVGIGYAPWGVEIGELRDWV